MNESVDDGDEVIGDAVRAYVGLLRVGAELGTRLTGASLRTTSDIATRVVSGARAGTPPQRLVEDAMEVLRESGREVLGIPTRPASSAPAKEAPRGQDEESLRRRGEALLRASADIDYVEDVHPAYSAILDVLAPDEARLLRHLAISGPSPAVDVRATPVTGSSELLASGLTLIGEQAGCRFLDRVPGYLNNLYRLGLLWFSREPLDADRYQMLEAQPPVQEALKAARRTKVVRRRIELTPFGEDFVRVCLPLEEL